MSCLWNLNEAELNVQTKPYGNKGQVIRKCNKDDQANSLGWQMAVYYVKYSFGWFIHFYVLMYCFKGYILKLSLFS